MKRNSFIRLIICAICIITVAGTFTLADTAEAAGDYSYEYKFTYGPWKQKKTNWVTAGGQSAGGYRFATGKGGFFYSNKGGPTTSVSFGASAGFASFSVGVSMGRKASTGTWVAVSGKPSYVKKHFYKLQVKKNIKARRKYMYRRLKYKGSKWTLEAKTYEYKVLSTELGVKQIK